MITLRTLKKKSKQALVVMQKHWPRELGDVFLAERGENYHGLVIRCSHGAGDPCLVPGRPRCDCTNHPLAGTPMTGGMSGHYQPEWSERTVYEVLADILWWSGRPDGMSEAEWVEALRVVGMTPASHVDRMAEIERLMADPLESAA